MSMPVAKDTFRSESSSSTKGGAKSASSCRMSACLCTSTCRSVLPARRPDICARSGITSLQVGQSSLIKQTSTGRSPGKLTWLPSALFSEKGGTLYSTSCSSRKKPPVRVQASISGRHQPVLRRPLAIPAMVTLSAWAVLTESFASRRSLASSSACSRCNGSR